MQMNLHHSNHNGCATNQHGCRNRSGISATSARVLKIVNVQMDCTVATAPTVSSWKARADKIFKPCRATCSDSGCCCIRANVAYTSTMVRGASPHQASCIKRTARPPHFRMYSAFSLRVISCDNMARAAVAIRSLAPWMVMALHTQPLSAGYSFAIKDEISIPDARFDASMLHDRVNVLFLHIRVRSIQQARVLDNDSDRYYIDGQTCQSAETALQNSSSILTVPRTVERVTMRRVLQPQSDQRTSESSFANNWMAETILPIPPFSTIKATLVSTSAKLAT